MKNFYPIEFKDGALFLLDQRELPLKEIFIKCITLEEVHNAIKNMVVRGAPCIGFTALFGIALWLKDNQYSEVSFKEACDFLIGARPTAINLKFEVEKAFNIIKNLPSKINSYDVILNLANLEISKSEERNLEMAKFATQELEKMYGHRKLNILTHCNTGFLACGSLGTALGVIEYLARLDRINCIWVDETRPYLQGSRLTSYELTKLNIPHKIVVEGASSFLMSESLVDAIFVGADRIVANGDTANKIGTANLSIIAKYFSVPMYTVAPLSSFDFDIKTGRDIEIEFRDEDEILRIKDFQISPLTASAFNPSFDVTKGENLTGIICEQGLFKAPYIETLKVLNK